MQLQSSLPSPPCKLDLLHGLMTDGGGDENSLVPALSSQLIDTCLAAVLTSLCDRWRWLDSILALFLGIRGGLWQLDIARDAGRKSCLSPTYEMSRI